MRGVRKSIHQSWLDKGLGLQCWGFKGVQEEIPSEGARGVVVIIVGNGHGDTSSNLRQDWLSLT